MGVFLKRLAIFLAICAAPVCAQTTYTAAGCSQSQVLTAVNAELASSVDGDIIAIPACPGGVVWSSSISPNFTHSVTIQGAGAISSTTGGAGTTGTDQTVLLLSGTAGFFHVGTIAGKSFRMTGIAFEGQSGQPPISGTGLISIGGTSTAVRLDHCHILIPGSVQEGVVYSGAINGVADHDYFSTDANGGVLNAILFENGDLWGGHTDAHGSWADSPHWGTSQFIFQEDSRFVDVGVTDMENGTRMVFRYNSVVCDSSSNDQCQMYNHGITTGVGRGFKEGEIYKNTWTSTAAADTSAMMSMNSGSALFWGNTGTGTWRFMFQVAYNFRNQAGGGGNYGYPAPPAGWGFCGPGNGAPQTGTINVTSGGVATIVTGPNLSTSWPANSPIIVNGDHSSFQMNSVISTTQMQLGSCASGSCGGYTGGALSGVSYVIRSAWDGNLGSRQDGYACLGQPGRGQGDLLSGSSFAALVNSTTGTVAWPHEVLTPIYSWMNTFTSTHYGGQSPALTDGVPTNTNNVDYFYECGSVNGFTNPTCSSFTGAAGTGFGLLSARPATCTGNTDSMTGGAAPGVAYFATDVGAQGTLYVCNPTNTWTVYYTPYTYPHPLTAGTVYQAATCGENDILAAITNEQATPIDGDIINIPAGTCTWTGNVGLTAATFTNSVTVQGAGAISSTTGGAGTTGSDNTIIIDNLTGTRAGGGGPNTTINLSIVAGKILRVTGFSMQGNGSTLVASQGDLSVNGPLGAQTRVDHMHIYNLNVGIYFGGAIVGVADHNYMEQPPTNLTNDYAFHNGDGANGDVSWTVPENFGSAGFLFVEDNRFLNGDIGDAHDGARYVLRHNTATVTSVGNCPPPPATGTDCSNIQMYTHGVTNARGVATRAAEIYQNTSIEPVNPGAGGGSGGPAFALNSGTALVWGNTATQFKGLLQIGYTCRDDSSGGCSYSYPAPPTNWGYCGTQFNGTGSGWDFSAVTTNGYPCFDQPGRGAGDLLSGNFSTVCNITRNPACNVFTGQWPRQALVPIYLFNNTYTPSAGNNGPCAGLGCGINNSFSRNVTEDTDFYQQYGSPYFKAGSFSSASNGGVGQGTLTPTTAGAYTGAPNCTTGSQAIAAGTVWLGVSISGTWGPGYWDTTNSTLYICTATNTWKAYYTPYTYPHPLTGGGTISTVLSSSRYINWSNAGLPLTFPDGETTTLHDVPPVRTKCGATLTPSGGNDAPQIISAMSACGNGTFVLLGPGNFQITTSTHLGGSNTAGHNNITLRGSGPMSTKITLVGNVGLSLGAAANGPVVTLASSPAQGATSVTLSSSGSTPTIGQIAWIHQCDNGQSGNPCNTGTISDTGGLYWCALNQVCDTNSSGPSIDTAYNELQAVAITSVAGAVIGFTPGLYQPDWSTSRSVVMEWFNSGFFAVGMGLEDFTLQFDPASGQNTGMNPCYGCWIKGIRMVNSPNSIAWGVSNSKSSLIANNYYADNLFHNENFTFGFSSDILVENNRQDTGFWEGGGASSGMVLAYNSTFDGEFQHQGGTGFNLFEGNEILRLADDDTWGTHNLNTYFRNYDSCWTTPYNYQPNNNQGILIDSFARFENVIGNALGSTRSGTPACPNYLNTFSMTLGLGTVDSITKPSTFVWGNYAVCTGDAHCNTVSNSPADNPTTLTGAAATYNNLASPSTTLPNSFYLPGSTPSWFTVCTNWNFGASSCGTTVTAPYPLNGPGTVTGNLAENTYANHAPATIAWQTLPIDSTYQVSYTVTSSSWAAGVETLNISGSFPTQPTGGFQISGVGGTCIPSSGLSYTGRSDGELLITSPSNTTSLTYALGVNPGTSCNGTVKWPDYRQFDERIYGASGGSTPAATPTYSPTAPYTGPPVSVTISDTTPSSTITYCIDGTNTCTPSITYSTPISISSTSYLRAFATASGFTQSATASGLYTIGSPAVTYFPPSVSFSPTLQGQSSDTFNITLKNTGTATLTVTQFGPTNSLFYATNNTCGTPATLIFGGATASFTLGAGTVCTFSVTYLPQAVNNFDVGGMLAIDNTAGGSDTLGLSGIGVTAPTDTSQFF